VYKRRAILIVYLYALMLFAFTYFYLGYLDILEANKPVIAKTNFFAGLGEAIAEGISEFVWYQFATLFISFLFCIAVKYWLRRFQWLWVIPFGALLYILGFIISFMLYHFPGIDPWENWYIQPVGMIISASILIKSIFFNKAHRYMNDYADYN
jgi:hypothetical protein